MRYEKAKERNDNSTIDKKKVLVTQDMKLKIQINKWMTC